MKRKELSLQLLKLMNEIGGMEVSSTAAVVAKPPSPILPRTTGAIQNSTAFAVCSDQILMTLTSYLVEVMYEK